MSEQSLVVAYTLYGAHEDAEKAAAGAVQAGLAACANILSPSESFYMWNGVFERQREFPVLFKTSTARRAALMQWLGDTHPYDVPALLSWDADAAPSYAQWVGEMTRET